MNINYLKSKMNFKSILVLFTLLLLISCKNYLPILASKESELKIKGDYDSYLALEYLVFSNKLEKIKDNKSANHFAKKALKISQGKEYVPENPLKWNSDKEQLEELILTQKRLEDVLNTPHLKFQLPIQLAHLSYLYDCWVSKESKPIFRASDMASCRVTFQKLLDEIEIYIADLKKDKIPKVTTIEPEFFRFEVLFDLNSSLLNDKANAEMIKIIDYLKTLKGDYNILLAGNADRTGNDLANQNLALNRAKTVQNYLIKNGVPENLIELRAYGEDFPDIITSDGTKSQINRSVGIYILKGRGDLKSYPLPLLENLLYREQVKNARKEKGLSN